MVAEYAPPMAPAVARPAMAQVASSAGMVSAGLAPPVVKSVEDTEEVQSRRSPR